GTSDRNARRAVRALAVVPRPHRDSAHRQRRGARHRRRRGAAGADGSRGAPPPVVGARGGQTDLALHIALGSSTQVALFVAPLLVGVGALLSQPMSLVFIGFEVVALGFASLIVTVIALDGESNWFEGAQLLALYALVALAVWFI